MPTPRRFVAATLALSLSAAVIADDLRVTIVAKTGDPASFVSPTATWSNFVPGESATYINPAGEIIASGYVVGPDVTTLDDHILVAGRAGHLRLIAREGQTSPDLPTDVVFDRIPFGLISPGGRVLFGVTLRGPGVSTSNDVALLLAPAAGSADPPRLVLREGNQAPELTAGVSILTMDLTSVSINDQVRIAISSTLAGAGITSANGQVMYRSEPDAPHVLRVVARAGEPAPGLGAGLNYATVAVPNLLPNGDLIATLHRAGAGISTTNDRTISIIPVGSTTPTPMFIEGDPVPGRPGATFVSLGFAILHSSERFCFPGTISENSQNKSSLWAVDLAAPTSPRAVAIAGDPAPGVPGAALSTINAAKFDLSSSGRAAYVAAITGGGASTSTDTIACTEAIGGAAAAALIAREGHPAPDISPPTNLGSMTSPSVNVAINARNQTGWIAPVAGTTTTTGFFFTDEGGATQLLARTGSPFQLVPGDVRTVTDISGPVLQAGQSPWRVWFNDSGQAAVIMSFAASPAPSSALVLAHLDPPAICRADFNNDGADTLQDLFDFLFAWFAQTPTADINGIDGVTLQDLFDFLFYWFQGC